MSMHAERGVEKEGRGGGGEKENIASTAWMGEEKDLPGFISYSAADR